MNQCLVQSTYPTIWKISRISPIPKVSNPRLVAEFRPVAVGCVFGKVFEGVWYNKLYRHVKGMLSMQQTGFLPKKSTSSNLINLLNSASDAVRINSQLDTIYFDFKKAFDILPIETTLSKLRLAGLAPHHIKFFAAFLNDRQQFVRYESTNSEKFHVFSGIQQGSKLAPLLFIISINDITDVVKYSNVSMYADDVKLYKTVNNVGDAGELQMDIDSMAEWADRNKFIFNTEKCAVITYTLKRYPIKFEYKLKNNILNRKLEIRDLGVLLRSDLSMESHINIVTSEALRNLGFVKRCSRFFENHETISKLFNAIVRSKLEYCSIVWDPPQGILQSKIEKVQNKLLRYLCCKIDKTNPMYISNRYLRERFKVVSLTARRVNAGIFYCYKILNGLEENQEFLNRLMFNTSRINRHKHLFYLPSIRTEREKSLPVYRILQAINERPELPLFCGSLHKLKTFLKQ